MWGPQAGAWGPQARAVKTLWVLGGSEAQTHVGTEEPDRPSHEGRRQLPRTAGVQSKPPWDGSESERGRSGAAGTLGVTHGDRD